MKSLKIVLPVAALLGLGTLAFSHDWPRNFDDAKFVCTSSLELEEGNPVIIRHNAMHWNAGIVEMIQKGDPRFKDFERRVGELENHLDIKLGQATLIEGKYDLIVRADPADAKQFILKVKPKKGTEGEEAQATFQMTTSGDEQDHLSMLLVPKGGAGSTSFTLQARYGKIAATLEGSMGDGTSKAK